MARRILRKKKLLSIVVVLSVINLVIFLFRDHFVYNEYASYNSLYSKCNGSCIKKWGEYAKDFPVQDLINARAFLDSNIGIGNESIYTTIEKIGRLLHNNFSKQLGNPAYHSFESPLEEYRFFNANKKDQLWCGHFADMFAFFCWARNIPCRIIEIMNPGDHHVLNECYDDKNQTWIMVDVTNNQLLTLDGGHHYLNLLDFRKSLAGSSQLTVLRSTDSGSVYTALADTEAYVNTYYKKDRPLFFYYRTKVDKIYSPVAKFLRYVLPRSWYVIYDKQHHSNILFFLKIFFLLLWLLTILYLIVSRK